MLTHGTILWYKTCKITHNYYYKLSFTSVHIYIYIYNYIGRHNNNYSAGRYEFLGCQNDSVICCRADPKALAREYIPIF